MNKNLKNRLRRMFCEHEWDVLYLDSRFHVERENPIHYWICRCKKCRKIMRVESGRRVM